MIHAFTVAAFLCALVSRVALALKGALCIDAVAISTQPDVLALINVCFGKKEKHALCSISSTIKSLTKQLRPGKAV